MGLSINKHTNKQTVFLQDPEDTVHSYEARGKSGPAGEEGSQYEEGMKALSEMERTQQVEAIQSYNQMKGSLMDYLRDFAASGRVVRQEDITQFFEAMQVGLAIN